MNIKIAQIGGDLFKFFVVKECPFISVADAAFSFEIRTFKMAGVTISEVLLRTLMKQIFKEEFEKQQENLLNIISGNFDTPLILI